MPNPETSAPDQAAPAPVSSDKTATATLTTGIPRPNGPVTVLTLRKPKGGDLRGLSLQALMQSDVNAIITVLPRICEPFITEQEAAGLEADDLAEVGGTLLGFFMTPAQKALIAQMGGG